MQITLPCWAATYRLEGTDTAEWLAHAFSYTDPDELCRANQVRDPSELYEAREIALPGWHFFYARPGDLLERIDAMFGLPAGCSRAVGRVHHPDARLPYAGETVAVPTREFAKTHLGH
jgi:hypothetical protein